MAILNLPSGYKEGQIYKGLDGKAYRITNGQSVEVTLDLLGGSQSSPPAEYVIGGKTYRRTIDSQVYLIENNQQILITDQSVLSALEAQLEKETAEKKAKNQTYMTMGAVLLIVLLLKGR